MHLHDPKGHNLPMELLVRQNVNSLQIVTFNDHLMVDQESNIAYTDILSACEGILENEIKGTLTLTEQNKIQHLSEMKKLVSDILDESTSI